MYQGLILVLHVLEIRAFGNSSGTLRHMSKVFLHVEINVRPGKFEEFVTLLSERIKIIGIEAGCEYIEIFQNVEQSDVVHVYETWSDHNSWDAHMTNNESVTWQKVSADLIFGETIALLKKL